MGRRRRHPRHEELLALLDGELDVERSLSIEEHCDHCSPCRHEWERLCQGDETLLALPRPALDASDRQRLLAGIEARLDRAPAVTRTGPAMPSRVRREVPLRVLVGAATLAAASLLVGVLLGRSSGPFSNSTSPSSRAIAERGDARPSGADTAALPPSPHGVAAPTDDSASTESPSVRASSDSPASSSTSPREELPKEPEPADRELVVVSSSGSEHDLDPNAAVQRMAAARALVLEAFERGAPLETERLATRTLAAVLVEVCESAESPWRARGLAELRGIAPSLGQSDLPLDFEGTIERWMSDPDRAPEAYQVARALDPQRLGRPRTRALAAALDSEFVRANALCDLCAEVSEVAGYRDVERRLRGLLRSSAEADQALVVRCLDVLPATAVPVIDLVLGLYVEGAPRDSLAAVIAHLAPAPLESLLARVGEPLRGRDEPLLQLVALGRVEAAVPALVERVHRGRSAAACLDTLEGIGTVRSGRALLELASDGALANSKRSLARDALVAWITESEDPRASFRALAGALEGPAETSGLGDLVALVRRLPPATGSELLLALAEDDQLDFPARSLAALELADRASPADSSSLLDLLEKERVRSDADDEHDPTFFVSLLVSVHRADPKSGLDSALERIGVELDPRRRQELDRFASLAAAEAFTPRFEERVARIDRLLRPGP